MSFPELRQLSTEKLYRMASFNFRKLDTALTENVEGKHELTDVLLDMQFRYYNLLQRLRSTDVKIYNYHFKLYYEKEDWTPVLHGDAFSKKGVENEYTKDHMDPPAFRNAPAFPLLSEAVSSQRPAVSSQDPGIRMQDSEISCRESGQKPAGNGQHEQISDQRQVAGGRQIASSDAELPLPAADNTDGIALSQEDNSAFRISDPEENKDTEPALEDHTAVTGTCSAEECRDRTKQVPVDPEILDQLSKEFTRDKMAQMLLDPEFIRRKPRLAGVFYYILYGDSQFLEPYVINSG